jgi:hypothetical protein
VAKYEHLVGIDFAEKCRLVGEQLEREHEAELRAPPPLEPSRRYSCLVHPTGSGYMAETIEKHPLVGTLRAYGRMPDIAVNELKIVLARELYKSKWFSDWDEARAYGRTVEFIREKF